MTKYNAEWKQFVISSLRSEDEGTRNEAVTVLLSSPMVKRIIKLHMNRFLGIYALNETAVLFDSEHISATKNAIRKALEDALIEFITNRYTERDNQTEFDKFSEGEAMIRSSYLYLESVARATIRKKFEEMYKVRLSKYEFLSLVYAKKAGFTGFITDHDPEELSNATADSGTGHRSCTHYEKLQYKLYPVFGGKICKEYFELSDASISYPETVTTGRERVAYSYIVHTELGEICVDRDSARFGINVNRFSAYLKMIKEEKISAPDRIMCVMKLIQEAEDENVINEKDAIILTERINRKSYAGIAEELSQNYETVKRRGSRAVKKLEAVYGHERIKKLLL